MNKTKKILIISPFFFPEPISTGKFNADLAIKLRDLGHELTVLCSHPFYPEWKVNNTEERLEGVRIIRGGRKVRYSKKPFVRRFVLEIWFTFFILRNIRKYQKEQDIVIPIFPPSLAFYCIVPFLRKNIKKIGMVHDLQIVFSSQKKGGIGKLTSFLIGKVEKKCFNACDRLIFLSEEMKQASIEHYTMSDSEKLKVQLPFITIKDDVHTNDLGDILKDDQHNIVYSGALSEKQYPEKLYEVFDMFTKNIENSQCFIFSRGPIFDRLKKANSNTRIKFLDLVPRENIEELYQKSTIQFVPQAPNTSKGSLPSKLPNLLASGTKLLVITDADSEIEKLFKAHKLNKVLTTWNKAKILNATHELLNKDIDTVYQKNIASKLFSMDAMISKIVD